MKKILQGTARRWGYSGWAVLINGASQPLGWTFSTTRREVRELVAERELDQLPAHKIVKCKVQLVVV